MINDRLIYRHRLWVRITHWINVVCMTILLMSGLQIFNATRRFIRATPQTSIVL